VTSSLLEVRRSARIALLSLEPETLTVRPACHLSGFLVYGELSRSLAWRVMQGIGLHAGERLRLLYRNPVHGDK
jgi:hypothetical protein